MIEILCDDSIGYTERVIMIITTDADNEKRFILVLLGWELVLTIYNKQEHLLYCLV